MQEVVVDEKNAKQINMVAFILAFYMDDRSKKELLINNFIKKKGKQEMLNSDSTDGELFKDSDDKEFRFLKDPHMVNMQDKEQSKAVRMDNKE